MRVDIGRRSTNAEVTNYLQQQADDAITRAIEIIRNRVDRYGVTVFALSGRRYGT